MKTEIRRNVHLVHLEDQVLYGGVQGARNAIEILRDLRNMLSGNINKNAPRYDVTLKWDGSPSIFAGIDPEDKRFFVAKKSIFNKIPKVYKSIAEIKQDTSGDLALKLTVAFEELQNCRIKGIIQGDVLFTKDDLRSQTIDGIRYTTFRPNTITYAVPYSSDLGESIRAARIGIVWHTTYKGSSLKTLRASFGVHLKGIKQSNRVWMIDSKIDDLTGKILFDETETNKLNLLLSSAGRIFQKISSNTLRKIEFDAELSKTIEMFNNSLIRKDEIISDPKKYVLDLISFVTTRFQKEIDERKTIEGKERIGQKMDEFLEFFSVENKANLEMIFQFQNIIVQCKNMIIEKLDSMKQIQTFIQTKDSFKVTASEGFVAIDKLDGGAIKLVDRLEFSKNNFNLLKEWNK